MNRKIRVLFLTKWYPNRYDPMPGLFIQRQAEALTPFCDVAVVYVHPDPDCKDKFEAEFSEENEVRVLRVYYKVSNHDGSFVTKVCNLRKFYRAIQRAIHSIRDFSPDLVHAHVLTRIGFIAWKVSRERQIPLVISEHWSRYFPDNNAYRGWFRKWLTSFIVKRAAAVVTVSHSLLNAMKKCKLQNKNFRIIPNVVDTAQFSPHSSHPGQPMKTMVHISCFEDRAKNISGFLRSIKELSDKRQDFHCLMIGAGPDWQAMTEFAGSLGIADTFVSFTGIKTGNDLASLVNNADFTVLSSFYETFGTVVIESLSCGVPVVATAVGIAVEEINEKNGLLVPSGDEKAMTDALDRMLDMCRSYDKTMIQQGIAEKYSKEAVGNQLHALYQKVLHEY